MFFSCRVCLIGFIFFVMGTKAMAQQQWPSSLLWRISGKGLSKPSYLFGTMHLQDKRLFNFGDSLYHSLANADGFALEIDFKELLDSMFAKQIQDAEDRFMESDEVKIDRKKLDKTGDSLLKKFGIKGDKLTKKDLKKIRDYRMNKILQQGEMQTIVDGYLYGLALRQNKWTGGIEDVSDQLNLIDEFGGDLTPDNVLQSDANMKKSLEEMISIYLKQDLQSLAVYSDAALDNGWKDKLLIRRNVKMAKRMDSLSAIRTMFFAVGAAHLPGDSGVISLLRRQGFTLDPVYSSQKIAAETYIKKLGSINWSTVEDEEKLYSIQMPGKPSEYNMFGQALKMKMFFDLPTMTFYITGHTIGTISDESDVSRIFSNIADRMGVDASKIKRKNIVRGDVHGAEGSFEAPQGSYKLQLLQKKNTLFMLMVGSPNKANLLTPDVEHFFTSFVPKELSTEKKVWEKFELKEKAFSVMMPGKPRSNKMIDKQGDNSGWSFATFDLIDNAKGFYYLLQVRDINKGFYLNGDSSYFATYKEDFEKRFDEIVKAEQSVYMGFPSYYMDAVSQKENLYYKVFHVIRGNRIYSLVVGGQINADFSDANTFFNSLNLETYAATDWTSQGMDGFHTTAPAPFEKIQPEQDENEEVDDRDHYVSYNSSEVVSYEIFKEAYDSLFWISNDSAFFEEKIQTYRTDGDTILKNETILNGRLKGVDLVIRKLDNNNLKKVRLFLNGDTLYTLISFIPAQYINDSRHQKFFTDFRVSKEIKSTIYTNKAGRLMAALQTKDSAGFEKAVSTLNSVKFVKADLPLLHQALLYSYRNQREGYSNVHSKLADAISDLEDVSTVGFIERNYHLLSGEKEALKYTMLEILARTQTREAYQVLKQLLLNNLPPKGETWQLEEALKDSLELTRTMYPDILALSRDSIFSYLLVGVTSELLDSNLLQWNEVFPFKNNFLIQAKKRIETFKKREDDWWQARYWIPFTARFNDKESNVVLQEFLQTSNLYIKSMAIVALAGNNQPVKATELEKVAADKANRGELYADLEKIKKQHLFPVKYANQKSLAESEVFALANEEYETSAITFLGERILIFEGAKRKFYLFKVVYNNEEDGTSESYLGITGPYQLSGGKLLTSTDASGIMWADQYDKVKTDRQLKEHLESIEQYRSQK